MDFLAKARIRIENWIHHNDHHQEEYEAFLSQLENAGRVESARHMREMIALSLRSNESLRKALETLDRV